ncbi:MAG: 2-C-methyl-D-erythritol 4-phosphate cytidylyltransferase [Chloroflexota bacterium]|nr:2-C-methyl-D-erythritol 4-phosphate cytidylyltransferase [Chloroflexota bacterium]
MAPDPAVPLAGTDDALAGVVIVAAGSGRRMAGDDGLPVDKVFLPLLGKPLLAHTVAAFEECPAVSDIVLVLGEHNMEKGRDLAAREAWSKLTHICLGGERRQDSVKAGLDRLSGCGWVMVHDGARPCVTPELVEAGLACARETGAAVPVVPLSDTVKRLDGDGSIVETPPRSELWAVQTPQVFRADLLRSAYAAGLDNATDDASLVERMGYSVSAFAGSPENLKVTTQIDMLIAEAILSGRAAASAHAARSRA